MIKKLSLSNFKCYTSEDFDFSDLTVFCGSNSSGKSTVIQSLLLSYQNYKKGNLKLNKLDLMGEYFSFGTLDDLQCHVPNSQYVRVAINDSVICVDSEKNKPDDYAVTLHEKVKGIESIFDSGFIYLSADRNGPKNSADIRYSSDSFDVGIYGQFAFSEYERVQLEIVKNKSLAKAILGSDNEKVSVKNAVKAAMQNICPGFTIETKSIKTIDKVTANYPSVAGKTIRPINVGFGFSFIFPIVLSAICIDEGGILIVENPELHLHPEAQSNLAYFLAMVSSHNVQVIIETHSDHIVNGVRVFAKEHSVDKIIVNSIKNSDGKRVLTKIDIDKDGNFSDLDDGFFDQLEKDLLRLF
ncbi:AAA family ATPase [Vibrio splendidus]|uniref:AAA family ATPase n=1 Tax=Vibrio splendidus TaxID=29497 RepID=UPI000C8242C0|nr:DUF3696 domain-containing protein [Vibrio splendidus]PMG53795.1 hypothetical protein BCU89_17490 [Vibrio splendidus]